LIVGVLPRAADASPEAFAAFAVAHLIGSVTRFFRSGWFVESIRHGKSPFLG
jgi:hypothetical protein